MELKQYILIIWRWSWLIILCGIVGGATAFEISRRMVATYAATTTILVAQDTSIDNLTRKYDALLASQLLARTYGDLLDKRPLLETVIANLRLNTNAHDLAARLQITVDTNTQLITLTVEDSNAEQAADIANEIVNVFRATAREQQEAGYSAIKRGLEEDLQAAQLEINRTQQSLDALRSATTPEANTERQRLEIQLSQHRNSYSGLLVAFATLRLADPQGADTVRIIEVATPANTPIQPRILLNTLLAVFVSVMGAVGAALLVELLDHSVRSAKDVGQRLGLTALAAIKTIPKADLIEKSVALAQLGSPAAEAFRQLRMKIDLLAKDRPCRTIAVTSYGSGEGTSTVVANLAIAFAQAGKQVIVVDANLRHPTLHTFFGQTNEYGLATALVQRGHPPIENILYDTWAENLKLLPSGPVSQASIDLLVSDHMTALIQRLRWQADIVLFDTPPLGKVADALQLTQACETTLFVVRAGSNDADTLLRAKDQILASGGDLFGAVLNRVKAGSEEYHTPTKGQQRYGRWRSPKQASSEQNETQLASSFENRKENSTADIFGD